jgi:MFS family permease
MPSARPGLVVATAGVAVLLYLDRVCLSIVGEQIKPALALTDREYALLLSGFFWAYALFQLPAGWVGDRFGAGRVLAAYLLGWSACTGLMGLAGGFAGLFVLRLGCGLFEAGAYPLAAAVVRHSVPAGRRGVASAAVAVGGRLGGAVAPVLTATLAAGSADGWRRPFLLYGGAGVGGAAVYFLWVRKADRGSPVGPPPVRPLAADRSAWLCSLVQFLANFAWVFVITLFPTYLEQVFAAPLADRAFYQGLPLYAGIVGMLVGGWATDRLVRSLGLRWGRALPVAVTRLAVGAAYVGCTTAADPLTATVLFCLVAAATDMGTAPVWAWAQDVGGRQVGAVLGWVNMWGNVGAAVAPLVVQAVRDRYPGDPVAGWHAGFLLCAAVQVVAAAAALGIDAARPVVRPAAVPTQP